MRNLIASIAVRNRSTRLYAKPMQNLDVKTEVTVLDYIVAMLRTIPFIEKISLGIAEGEENLGYVAYAQKHKLSYVIGSEKDVLGRLIQSGEKCEATDVLRKSSESPYQYFEILESAWEEHVKGDYDFTCVNNIPDGSSAEIIRLDALKYSHLHGEDRHRSEFCSLYIRENKNKFKIQYVQVPPEIKRTDIRLTIDNPEDLILCRAIYAHFKEKAPRIPVAEIIKYLDANPQLKALVDPFIEEGLKTMYL